MLLFIILVAFAASGLTFFSGFGLGTILLPAFALFFDLTTSILLTAIVHFLNNVFKFFLVIKNINTPILLKFGLISLIAALIGAWCLRQIDVNLIIYQYNIGGKIFCVTLSGLVVGCLILIFALWEMLPVFKNITFNQNKLWLGGFLSGFFGGLTGHQGALRSAFLMRMNLNKEAFIATGVAIACIVDLSRMSIYVSSLNTELIAENYQLLIAAVVSAWIGAVIGNKLLKKVTLSGIKWFVSVFMIFISLCIIAGLLNN